jgi:hypothetical protein
MYNGKHLCQKFGKQMTFDLLLNKANFLCYDCSR